MDIDLAKFDRVNHDKLMARVARVVTDRRVLGLIRQYLESGVMVNGVVVETGEGTLQSGPLSPLLANSLLDDLDKGLERRGHRFGRYADRDGSRSWASASTPGRAKCWCGWRSRRSTAVEKSYAN